ncbi:MAG: hypothetical protein IJ775_03355, partial [Muribaculaceae bacterium]|nr:hypothetical protein [Muribaculaceae bacterium]
MRKFILLLASVLVMSLGMKASGSGVWRTAITLKNGTQEIYPDSVVQRFDFVPAPDGRHRALSVRWRGDSVARVIPIDSIAEINYGEMTPYEHFAGDWYLVASPNGVANEVGLMIATVVSIPYHAVLPAPGTPDYGKYIYCHVDSLPHRKGLKYAADFKLRYDFDEASQRGNISIVLDDQLPFSEVPYTGGPETYAYADAT